ncbi:MAG: pyrroline-5-carboxylate reductase [Phycisphaerales bacterium]|nr:pyrroline-5-carboxylate reductase [Phycisphaerales bacterium]
MATELLVIGGGSMGGAIVRGAIGGGRATTSVAVVEPNPDRRTEFKALGVAVVASVAEAPRLTHGAMVLVAVKPQVWPQVAPAVQQIVEGSDRGRLVVSVMAGVNTSTLALGLGPDARIVRTMPNLGALVGAGMTAVAAGPGATSEDLADTRAIFEPIGQVMSLDEDLMDAFTGVAGSGPAYVFLLAEAMAAAGQAAGLSEADAARAARQTVVGAARVLEGDDRSAAQLREAVTSPGGTTAAALRVLAERGFGRILGDAIKAARDRGRELGA